MHINIKMAQVLLSLWRVSIPLHLRVVQSQPGPVKRDGKWSTELCECWGDMDDCECLFTVLMAMQIKINHFTLTAICLKIASVVVCVCVSRLLCFLLAFICLFRQEDPCLPLLDCVGCRWPCMQL